MRKKILGRTGIEVSIVGLGGGCLGLPPKIGHYKQYVDNPGHASLMDEKVGAATVCAAIEAGITLIDTAPLYGYNGSSERIIGETLANRQDLKRRCTVETKVGRLYDGDGFNYTYDETMRCVEGTLARLRIDRLPVLYLHDPMGFPVDFVMSDEGALGALRTLKQQKVIDYIGVAANDPETAADYIETGAFDAATVSDSWSLVNQRAAKRILPAARRHNVGLVATTVVEHGLLATGKMVPGAVYSNRNFSRELLDHVASIDKLCGGFNIPILAAAVQWATRDPQFATAIPGAQTPEEALMNAEAGSISIPQEFWDALDPLIQQFDY
jgi:D-threo-aldose 1-dehydrogenase